MNSAGSSEPSTEAKLLYSQPRDPRRRLKRHTVLGMLGTMLWSLLLGGFLLVSGGAGLAIGWIGALLTVLAASIAALTPFWLPHIRSARRFYVAEAVVRLPLPLLLLAGGMAILAGLLPAQAFLLIAAGLAVGFAFVPGMISRRRMWIQESLKGGHLRGSWNRERGKWDVRNDFDHIRKDPKIMRPGALWRVGFWIGPAIGMSLAGLLGDLTASLIVAAILVLIGYTGLIFLVVVAEAWRLELSILEKQSGGELILDPTV